MRVIGGACKGRVLKTPDWEGLRPTSDRLRETLFNVLAPRIEGVRFLPEQEHVGGHGETVRLEVFRSLPLQGLDGLADLQRHGYPGAQWPDR